MQVIGDAVVSWLHFVLVFGIVSALTAELIMCRPGITPATMRRLSLFDAAYGLSALALLGVGFLRAARFAKGWDYYATQPWFWVKLATFAAVGLLSLPPSLQFLRWRRALRAGEQPQCDDETLRRLRRMIHAELALMPLIALAAALMARGITL